MCHSRQANFALTLHEAQLNRGDQLAAWERVGMIRAAAAGPERGRRGPDGGGRGQRPGGAPEAFGRGGRGSERLLRFVTADDPQAPLEARARSYLAVNCSHCHTPDGGGNSPMNFDWQVPVERMRAIGERPQHGDFGLNDARIIAPGDAGRSVMLPRVALRGPGQMPPVGTRIPDAEGMRLLVEWIQSRRE